MDVHRDVGRVSEARPPRTPRSIGHLVGDGVLTVAAVLGAICLVLVLLAVVLNASIVLFSTGSMSPAIPAGSAALVREIPASEIAVGDVVTVDRSGKLPITHRVIAISGDGAEREIVMRGDANTADDPLPYTVSTVRIVLFAVPGIAPAINALGHPLVLGATTLAVAVLVTWAFWPRRSPPPTGRHRQVTGALGSTSTVLAAAVILSITPAQPVAAAPAETVIEGAVLRVTSIIDADAASNLSPGTSTDWIVGVETTTAEPGIVELALAAEAGELAVELLAVSCPVRWREASCPGALTLLDTTVSTARSWSLGSMPAQEQRWLRITVRLPDDAATGVSRVLRVHADGFGESVEIDTGGHGSLTPAGFDARLFLALGSGVLLVGTGVIVGARRSKARRS